MKMTRDIFNEELTVLCECCGSDKVTVDLEDATFEYNDNKSIFELPVKLPVFTCSECELQYTGEEAEYLKHDAICKHHRHLNPYEIRSIRLGCGLSKQGLSELTGFGTASISRWESGQLLQSKSSDKLLRLLGNSGNLSFLQNLNSKTPKEVSNESKPAFLYLKQAEQATARSHNFLL
jgi:putative zinc finger/helix-turn-helix YgiT family protein